MITRHKAGLLENTNMATELTGSAIVSRGTLGANDTKTMAFLCARHFLHAFLMEKHSLSGSTMVYLTASPLDKAVLFSDRLEGWCIGSTLTFELSECGFDS